mgnify:CR=1 FL=1
MPYLALIRHGQSHWNLENRFTGWWDADLTDKGIAEAQMAGPLLVDTDANFQLAELSFRSSFSGLVNYRRI